jgi:hypothetical protein
MPGDSWFLALEARARRPAARPVTSRRHVTVLEARPGSDRHLVEVSYRQLAIEIGIGPDPRIAGRIPRLGRVHPRAIDTRDTGDCARAAGMNRMPAPAPLGPPDSARPG